MRARRRITNLEHRLTTAEHILAWVADVREHDTVGDYARSVLDERPPLATVIERVTGSTKATPGRAGHARSQGDKRRMPSGLERSADPDPTPAVVRRSTRETVFLYCLVLQVNCAANEAALRASLGASLSVLSHRQYSGCLLPHADPAIDHLDLDSHPASFWPVWLEGARGVLRFAHVEATARARIATRYFAGEDVLFSEAIELGRVAAALLEELSSMVDPDALPRAARRRRGGLTEGAMDADADFEARVAASVAGLRDAGRIDALTMLGEDGRAVAIAEAILRIPTEPAVADDGPGQPASGP